MLTPMMLLLAAAPVEVVAAPRDSGGMMLNALTKALPGATVVNGTELYEYLFGVGLMLGQDFDGFTAAPRKDWPAPLAATWRDGLAHCNAIAGPPPWKSTRPAAMACGSRLSTFLWQRFAQHHGARNVTVVWTTAVGGKKSVRVSGETWRPGEAMAIAVEEFVSEADLKPALDRVVKALVERTGTTQPREVIDELVSKQSGVDPFAGEPVVDAAVPGLKSCAALPASLTVAPESVLAKSLGQRWASSVKGAGAAQKCELSLSQHDEESMMGPMTVTAATVKCGDVTGAAEAAKAPAAKTSQVDRLSAGLVKSLVQRWCR